MNMKLLPQLQTLPCPLAIPGGHIWIDASAYKDGTEFKSSMVSVHPNFTGYLNVINGSVKRELVDNTEVKDVNGRLPCLVIENTTAIIGGNFSYNDPIYYDAYTIGVVSVVYTGTIETTMPSNTITFVDNMRHLLSKINCTSSNLYDLANAVPGSKGQYSISCERGINSGASQQGEICYCKIGDKTTNPIKIHLFELLQYTRTPTREQQARLQGYLAWKWGIPDKLPGDPVSGGTHRYKFSRPPPDGFNPVTCTS